MPPSGQWDCSRDSWVGHASLCVCLCSPQLKYPAESGRTPRFGEQPDLAQKLMASGWLGCFREMWNLSISGNDSFHPVQKTIIFLDLN